LYELHIYNRSSSRGVFSAACILAAISLVLFVFMLLFSAGIYFIALVLIGIGFLMMLKRRNSW
jgi:fatty acid desaturase